MTDPEVIRITSISQIGKSDEGAILISRTRDADDPQDVWLEFASPAVFADFMVTAQYAYNDYIARELDIVL